MVLLSSSSVSRWSSMGEIVKLLASSRWSVEGVHNDALVGDAHLLELLDDSLESVD